MAVAHDIDAHNGKTAMVCATARERPPKMQYRQLGPACFASKHPSENGSCAQKDD
jgi:hypothetical protein